MITNCLSKLDRRVTLVVVLVLLLAVGSCGVYTFNPRGQSTISTVAVEPFENKTDEYGLTDRLTEVIVDAFIADGTLRVVPASEAEAILTGTLTSYKRIAEKFDQNDQVEEYKVVMDFSIVFKNPADQSNFWSEQMRHEGIYRAADEIEEDGQARAGTRLVEAVLNKTTKSW